MSRAHVGSAQQSKQKKAELRSSVTRFRWLAFILAVASVWVVVRPQPLTAQSTNGAILGTVKDTSGAPIPSAQVSVTNEQTNLSKTVATGTMGDYEAPDLLPGTYDVSVEVRGFKKSVQRGFVLSSRVILRVDATLQVGAVTTVVQVTGTTPAITTENATISEHQDIKVANDLPLNFRATNTGGSIGLVSMVPGVQVDNGFNPTLAGNYSGMNDLTMDGFSIMTVRYNNADSRLLPSTEEVAEVSVTSELGNAEFGQVGQMSFVGRGGTNQYHGALFEYFQNDAMDAIPLFETLKATKRANDFGGVLGGPVRFPGYNGRDRTFFFFDWESDRDHTSSAIVEGVPSLLMREGNFTELSGTTLTNPFTGQPYNPSNIIPAINSVSASIMNTFYPKPTFNSGDVTSNYRIIAPAPTDTDQFDLRMDERLSEKQLLWGRLSYRRSNTDTPLGLLQGDDIQPADTYSIGITHNYTFAPNLLNEARFGIYKLYSANNYTQFPNGAALVHTLGLDLPGPFPAGSGLPGIGFQQSGIAGTNGARQETRHDDRYQIDDNFTWVHNSHTLKFGIDLRKSRFSDDIIFLGPDNFGLFDFDGAFSGYDYADFLLGLPSSSFIANAGPPFNAYEWAYGFYGQDQFRVTPNLNLSFGLRYEVHPPYFDQTLQMTNFDLANGAVVAPNAASLALTAPGFAQGANACPGYAGATTPCTPFLTAAQAGIPRSLRFTDWSKILPRFSFAYHPSAGWVLRGGVARYDVTLSGVTVYNMIGIKEADTVSFENSITDGVAAYQFPAVGLVGPGLPTPFGSESFYNGQAIHTLDPDAWQWNLTVERELASNTGLRMTYTGMRTNNLMVNYDMNQVQPHLGAYNPAAAPYPNWDQMWISQNGGSYANYNGLTAVLTHRFSHGLTAQSSYSFARNLSDAGQSAAFLQGSQSVTELGPYVENRFDLKSDYGNVDYDRRHRWLTTYVYDIPFGRRKRFGSGINKTLDSVVGNWRTSGIIVVQSGPFMTPNFFGGPDPSATGANNKGNVGQRPDRVCNGSVANPTPSHYWNINCFPLPMDSTGNENGIGRFGDSGVDILTAPGTVLWNAGVFKIFPIKEKARMRFEVTSTNVLNHPNFGIPDANVLNGSDFGVIHGGQGVEGSGQRTIQLGLRFDF